MLLPDIVEIYGGDADVSLLLNPQDAPEEFSDYVKKSFKVVFSKDQIEIFVAAYFDLLVKD